MSGTDESRARLSAYLDGELPEDERTEVEASLQADPGARAEYELLRAQAEALRALPRKPAPAAILAGVRARLANEPAGEAKVVRAGEAFAKPAANARPRWTLWSAAAMLVAGVLVFAALSPYMREREGAVKRDSGPAGHASAPPAPAAESPLPKSEARENWSGPPREEADSSIHPQPLAGPDPVEAKRQEPGGKAPLADAPADSPDTQKNNIEAGAPEEPAPARQPVHASRTETEFKKESFPEKQEGVRSPAVTPRFEPRLESKPAEPNSAETKERVLKTEEGAPLNVGGVRDENPPAENAPSVQEPQAPRESVSGKDLAPDGPAPHAPRSPAQELGLLTAEEESKARTAEANALTLEVTSERWPNATRDVLALARRLGGSMLPSGPAAPVAHEADLDKKDEVEPAKVAPSESPAVPRRLTLRVRVPARQRAAFLEGLAEVGSSRRDVANVASKTKASTESRESSAPSAQGPAQEEWIEFEVVLHASPEDPGAARQGR